MVKYCKVEVFVWDEMICGLLFIGIGGCLNFLGVYFCFSLGFSRGMNCFFSVFVGVVMVFFLKVLGSGFRGFVFFICYMFFKVGFLWYIVVF